MPMSFSIQSSKDSNVAIADLMSRSRRSRHRQATIEDAIAPLHPRKTAERDGGRVTSSSDARAAVAAAVASR